MTATNLLSLEALMQRRAELERRNLALGAAIDQLDAIIAHRTGARATPRHGTPRRYGNGCRCARCRKAHTTEMRRYRRRRADREEPS